MKSFKHIRSSLTGSVMLLFAFLLVSCGAPQAEKIRYGSDQCVYCKMAIIDQSFGAELLTNKGKVYKFDSIECLAAFEYQEEVKPEDIHSIYMTDIKKPGVLLEFKSVIIFHSDQTKSPMGMGFYAVNKTDRKGMADYDFSGKMIKWDALKRMVAEAWM